MKKYTYSIPVSDDYKPSAYITQKTDLESLLFFDIETTGFIASDTTLYLIGALYYEENNIHIIQWFNENGIDEESLLLAFKDFSKNYTHLVHFNGTGFDLPYLCQKAQQYNIPFDLDSSMSQIDIYKDIKPYKKVFHTDNLKQISIEKYLKIKRDDTYSGKELINIYQRYVATPKKEYENLLLLHNHDDLLGMTQISEILNYVLFFNDIDIRDINMETENNELHIYFKYSNISSIPVRILLTYENICINVYDTDGFISIPIYKTTLKHYLPDYKNYYYLPIEDMAVHKSVATYVEPEHRIKATKNNCYIKKEDTYIPCFYKDCKIPIFMDDIKAKSKYITLDSLYNGSFEEKRQYLIHLIKKIGK